IYFLARTGIVTAAWMRKNRKIMLVLTLVLSAIITPPDVFSQIMVAIPLIILYEFSIRIAAKVEKKRVVSMD
ncbi:MAG TPA: twin-arginine translocase subunit TatC, partial [Bacteroidales bacterium]|nr:twin-arginine translocase subunit TatC [Bacteroidales bacterium]